MGASIWELRFGAGSKNDRFQYNFCCKKSKFLPDQGGVTLGAHVRSSTASIWELLYGSFYMGASIWGNSQHSARNSQHMGASIWEPVYGSVYMGVSIWELLYGSFYMVQQSTQCRQQSTYGSFYIPGPGIDIGEGRARRGSAAP